MSLHLGKILATSRVSQASQAHSSFSGFIRHSLQRHLHHDWGDTSDSDTISNDFALNEGGRIISVYLLPKIFKTLGSDRIWIITEAVGESGTRECTTVLFPSDY